MDTNEKLRNFMAQFAPENKQMRVAAQDNLTPAEREARIAYLVNLFRLSFRTNKQYEESLSESMSSDDFHDDRVDFSMGEPAGFRDADVAEMEDLRVQFQRLGAEDKFNQCCLDYYQDVLDELQARNAYWQNKLLELQNENVIGAVAAATPDPEESTRPMALHTLHEKKMAALMDKYNGHRKVNHEKLKRQNLAAQKKIKKMLELNSAHQAQVVAKLQELQPAHTQTVDQPTMEK